MERFLREAQGKDFSDLDNIKEIKFESKGMKLNIRKEFCLEESNKEFIEQLNFICNLKKEGYLTQEEFEQVKRRIFK